MGEIRTEREFENQIGDKAMTFEQIKEVNKALKTTPIKGKNYVEVNERVKAFRMLEPEGCISTEILSLENGVCVIKATIINSAGQMLATGIAYEKEGSSNINKTSYIENCETSAIGRALGMCGIGIDTSIASYEEVANAIENQENPAPVKEADTKLRVLKYVNNSDDPKAVAEWICKNWKVESPSDLKPADCLGIIKVLKEKGKEI